MPSSSSQTSVIRSSTGTVQLRLNTTISGGTSVLSCDRRCKEILVFVDWMSIAVFGIPVMTLDRRPRARECHRHSPLYYGTGGRTIEADYILSHTLDNGLELARAVNDTSTFEEGSLLLANGIQSAALNRTWQPEAGLFRDNKVKSRLALP